MQKMVHLLVLFLTLVTCTLCQGDGEASDGYGEVCGSLGTVRISASPKSHAPDTQSETKCVFGGAKFPPRLRLTLVGPATHSPMRSASTTTAILDLFDVVKSVFTESPSSLGSAFELLGKIWSTLRLGDFFYTFATPPGILRMFYRQQVTFSMKYWRRGDLTVENGPFNVYRVVQDGADDETDVDMATSATDLCSRMSTTIVPAAWKRWWRGEQYRILIGDGDDVEEQCTLDIPSVSWDHFIVAVHSRRAILNDHPAYAAGKEPRVTVRVEEHIDWLTIRLLLTIAVITVLRPMLSQQPVLQFMVAAMFGLVIVLIIAGWFVFRDFHRTRLGRIGLLAVFSLGGWAAVGEGALSAFIAILIHQFQHSMIFKIISLVSATIATGVTHWYFREKLKVAADWSLFLGQRVLLVYLAYENVEIAMEATLLLFWAHIIAWFGGFRIKLTIDDDEPKDSFPAYVHNGGEYRRPITSSYVPGRTPQEKMRNYERMGSNYTQYEVDRLREHIRQNPGKYTTRIRDPNGMARWAGEPVDWED